MGALSINGIPALRAPFEPLVPDVIHVRNTNRYHRPPDETEEEFTAFLLEDLESAIVQAGPETVAMVIMEPVQNAGGSFTPPQGYWRGVREICDRYGILLCADEVITGFGRIGDWFGSELYDIQPDLITWAKGLSSAYASIGAVIAADHVVEPFMNESSMYAHGITFGGHPVQCAIALKNIEIMKRERIVENVRDNGDTFRATLEQLLDLPIVGDLRGTGFFYAIELVKDKETRETFTDDECETLLRGFLSPRLFEKGLICRADDRGDPVDPDLTAADRDAARIRRNHRNPWGGAERSMATNVAGRTDDSVRAGGEGQAHQVAAPVRHGVLHDLRVRRAGHARLGREERPAGIPLARRARRRLRRAVHAADVGGRGGVHARRAAPTSGRRWRSAACTAASQRSSTGSRTRSGSAARSRSSLPDSWSANVSQIGTATFGDYAFKLIFIWISIGVAIISLRHGKWIPNFGAILRFVVLGFFSLTVIIYGIKHGFAGFQTSQLTPDRRDLLRARAGAPLQLRRLRAAERRGRGDGEPAEGRAAVRSCAAASPACSCT